jgi:gliding motility-associated-like protein
MKRISIVTLLLVICTCRLYAQNQNYVPVAISGYNNDIIAETGTDAMAVTSTGVDLQQKILYSLTFATTNGLLGGLADNGTIVNGTRTYQLGDYTLNNALYLSANAFAENSVSSGTLTLNAPTALSKLSILAFSTEQTSTMNITLHFADTTTFSTGPVTVLDWFNGINPIIQSVGRIKRIAAPPYVVEDLNAHNPRFYPVDINIPCDQKHKMLDSITFDYIIGGGNDSRAVVLAVSATPFVALDVTADIHPADCGKSNGSVQVSSTGGTPLITYEWNTVPVKLTPSATDLPAGNYTCTITDGELCKTLLQAEVTERSVVRMKATARPADICSGSTTTLAAIPSGGIILGYEWLPGNSTDSAISVSPADTTSYIVKGKDVFGCYATDTIQVTVTQRPPAPVSGSLSLCPDSTATLTVQSPNDSLVYNWYPYPSGGDIYNTGEVYVTPAVAETTTYYVEAVRGVCSSDRTPVTVTPFDRPVSPVVSVKTITTTGAVFTWKSVPGSTGYLVSIDGGAYVTVIDTTYTIPQIQKDSVTIRVISLGALSCQTSLPGSATAKLKPLEIFVPNAFSPNGDGKNDIFKPEGSMKALNMKIFNQWGELISEINTVGSGWNGTSGGKAQPMGVYMYAIKIILTNGSEITKKGAVNLLR